MFAQLKRRLRHRLRGRPGRRFQDHYYRSAETKQTQGRARRLLNLVLAVVALAIAVVLMVFPGPAVPFFVIAGILLAAESLLIARLMDWLEVKARAASAWLKRRWDRLPHRAQVTLKCVMPCVSICGAYFSWRLFHR
jgi:hypothetical protein